MAQKITVTVFKVTGETNTDDLSPAPDAWSRPDIPLHYLAMLKNARPGITPEEDGKRGPIKFIEDLKTKGHLVAYVGDVVGTGSSRKSAKRAKSTCSGAIVNSLATAARTVLRSKGVPAFAAAA